MAQSSFLTAALSQKTLRRDKFLAEMSRVIPWEDLCALIRP